ncbi:MAG: hypothetical protein ACRC8S_19525 [Fimbriiglobus sp.]
MDNLDESLADTTPPDELGAARLPMTTACLLAMPMSDTGDYRGAHEVYACTARMILKVVPHLDSLKADLAGAIESADLEPEAETRAALLQQFFLLQLGELPHHEEDDDELEPLDRIQGYLSSAITIGAPAYNVNLKRGCTEVYAATARLILSSFTTPPKALERINYALQEYQRLPEERQQAWVLRDAFDDVLRMKDKTIVRNVSMQERQLLISMAIQIGAPAYNHGDHRGCYEVYATVCRLLLHTLPEGRAAEVVREALQSAALVTDVTEQAWILRRALDVLMRDVE